MFRQLAESLPREHESLRFWGKITTRGDDYVIVEGKATDDMLGEFDESLLEGKEGGNRYTYWLTRAAGGKWQQLPPVTQAQISAARKASLQESRYFSRPLASHPSSPNDTRLPSKCFPTGRRRALPTLCRNTTGHFKLRLMVRGTNFPESLSVAISSGAEPDNALTCILYLGSDWQGVPVGCRARWCKHPCAATRHTRRRDGAKCAEQSSVRWEVVQNGSVRSIQSLTFLIHQ